MSGKNIKGIEFMAGMLGTELTIIANTMIADGRPIMVLSPGDYDKYIAKLPPKSHIAP